MEPPDDSLRGWDAWGDVTPLERSVLLILAVAGRPLTRLYFPPLLSEGRRPCPPEQADGAVDALLQRGLLVDTSDGVALPTESATLVLRHAALTGPWHVLDATARFLGGQASVRLAFCRSATNLGAPLDRQLLDLENDRSLDPILFDLCLRPFHAPWFGRLPHRWQTMVARRLIPYALDQLRDVRPLLAKDLGPLPDDVCFAIGVHALMQGGKSQARGWPKEALAALASFLEADSTAADAFDDARRAYKEKNDTKPPHVLTLFHLLALHGAGRPLDAQRLARSVSRKSPLLRLSDALQGAAPVSPTLDDATVWELLFEGLLHAVSSTPLPPSLAEQLDDAALRARACGLLWIADQLDHLLGRRCTRWLPLPSLLQRNAPWEEVLRRLDEAAARGGSDRGRIVWTLRWDGTQVTSIEACEQHPRGGTGIGWTAARPTRCGFWPS